MIPYTEEFPAVTVIVPCSGLARYTTFEMSMEALHVPSGTTIVRAISANLALNVNEGIRLHRTPYYWFIDDDHQFEPWILLRLLAHQVPIVVPLTCLSKPPFSPVLFQGEKLDEKTGYKMFRPYTWQDLDGEVGLKAVHACGRAGMLVAREVFETLKEPWFELGKTHPEHAGEDVYFCQKARAAGFQIVADLDLTFGHISPSCAWPTRMEDGSFTVRLQWDNGQSIIINRPDRPPSPPAPVAPLPPGAVEMAPLGIR